MAPGAFFPHNPTLKMALQLFLQKCGHSFQIGMSTSHITNCNHRKAMYSFDFFWGGGGLAGCPTSCHANQLESFLFLPHMIFNCALTVISIGLFCHNNIERIRWTPLPMLAQSFPDIKILWHDYIFVRFAPNEDFTHSQYSVTRSIQHDLVNAGRTSRINKARGTQRRGVQIQKKQFQHFVSGRERSWAWARLGLCCEQAEISICLAKGTEGKW